MSESADTDVPAGEDTEAAARRMGWKPQSEYGGKPDKWVPAKQFLETGFGSPAVLAERYKTLDDRYANLERDTGQMKAQLGDAVATIQTMTSMVRSAEQRAYDRAKKELLAERDKAIDLGDRQAVHRVEAEMTNLEKTLPPPEVPRTAPAPTRAPDVDAFIARNSWYKEPANRHDPADLEIGNFADTLFNGLNASHPNLPLSSKLAEVEKHVRKAYAERFKPARQAEPELDDDEPAPSVMPSGQGQARAPRRQAGTFDAMPKDSKDAFARYQKMLTGKGEQLTKEEWAATYWAQEER